MADADVEFEDGLTESEVEACESRYGFIFPPDLRALLQSALPVGIQGGQDSFPNWRQRNDVQILDRLDWPFEGLAFDIEHNDFWWPTWGLRPERLEEAIEIARGQVSAAPRLIPICSHRYLPESPCEAGNPVFSVHQTDVIYYGCDLWDYIRNEFGPHELHWQHSAADENGPRIIEFWTDMVNNNHGAT